jgi:hypothetical protein
MKKLHLFLLSATLIGSAAALMSFTNEEGDAAHHYLQLTTIESAVPGGLARSRMIATDKTGAVEEVKLENFYSMVGINFENIRFNDAQITTKLEAYAAEGWELVSVTSAFTSTPGSQGSSGGNGIVISRYLLKKHH